MKLPQIGEIWLHYKGGAYVVTGILYGAENADLEIRVSYCKLGDPLAPTFSRSLNNFLDLLPDGRTRFTYTATSP